MACAESCRKLKWFEEAISIYVQAISVNPQAPAPYQALGTLYFSQNDFLAAQDSHRMAIEKGSKAGSTSLSPSSHCSRTRKFKGSSRLVIKKRSP